MVLVCMHSINDSVGRFSAQCVLCHMWKSSREGARTTIRLLCRYFLYRYKSSFPQDLMVTSKPPLEWEQRYEGKYH